MPSLINATKLVLLLLCAVGYYATWHLLLNNGTTEHMTHMRDSGPHLLPGTDQPLKTVYTGLKALDYQLTVLALFFWELVDGSLPDASLFCFHFATQVACGWGLLMVEGLRHGNRWRVISFIGTWGILIQNAAYAVIVPIYLFIYLSTSPVVSSRHVSDHLVDTPDLVAIPVSLALGYVLPAIFMSLPAPSIIGSDQKQTFMSIWQMFPLWVAVLQELLPYLVASFVDKQTRVQRPVSPDSLNALRAVYLGLLIVAGTGQIATLTLLATSQMFPSLFAPEFFGIFRLSNVFKPAAISSSSRMPSIGSGAFQLLQYDEITGSTAMATWATVLFANTYKSGKAYQSPVTLTLKGIATLALTGPLGYAVACIWARDEILLVEAVGNGGKEE